MFCFAKQKLLITSDNSVYLVTAFIQKPPPISAYANASADIRYTDTLSEIYFEKNYKTMHKYRIVSHTDEYEKMFETAAKLIANIFSDEIISINHVGSTSVKGLGGKPTIDILVVVKDISKFDQYKSQMITAGYELLAGAVPGGWLFIKNIGDERVENIHFFEKGHPEINRMLVVRDYLRKQPLEVKKYFAYKEQLLQLFPDDYSKYRRKKDEYFQQLMERALSWSINK